METIQQRIAVLEKKVGADTQSPLFAQLAHYYLEANRVQDALRLCDAGLANFPFYTTGHLIKGKTLVVLNMKAEARREFEFVIELLPNNETVLTLLSQLPLSEEETLTTEPPEAQHETYEPEQAAAEYGIPSALQPSPESGYDFGVIDQPASEPQPEPSEFTAPPSGSSFFDAITQAPVAATTEEQPGFEMKTLPSETAVTPEPSSFDVFDVSTSTPPSVSETPEPPSFVEVTTPPSDQPSGFEFSVSAPDVNIPETAPTLQEETFESYALRRRSELSGENTMSLEDYLSDAGISLPQEILPETPVSDNMQREAEKFSPSIPIDLPQEPQSIQQVSIHMQPMPEELLQPPQIILPEAPPPETQISTGEQNKIEELATKLQTAGKITPVIDMAQKETPPASDSDTPTGIGFVTPTLAEIYAKQGWFDDAIKAYKTLMRSKPGEKDRYEKRIAELEELKNRGKV